MMTKVRDSYFDNAKFFLILLVVFGHSLTNLKSDIPVINSLYTFIFIFHMPAFILISGYFSKHFRKPGYVRKVVKKTLIPYFIFQVAYSYFYYMTGYEKVFKIDLVSPHWTLWFLVSILFWKLMIIPFSRLGKPGLPIAIMLGVAAGFFNTFETDFSASRTLAFFPFFYLGYLLKKEQFMQLLTRTPARIASLFVLIGVFLACHDVFPNDLQDWVLHDSSYHTFGLSNWEGGITRLFVYGISFLTIFAFMALIPKKRFSFTALGKNTLYVYLLHGFFIKTMVLFPLYKNIEHLYQYSFLFTASLALCYLLASRPVRLFTKPFIEIKMPRLQQR
ncbi:acyltransferase family protein [Sporolactobacillus terrae]|uniref:Acyltransferase n=1 Tax=Sporolactobacillus terrae TaxID=269673 RepID=A0A5K7WYW3_9BACL|nr:acyltransferase family protein [Sporolactobacillus terrae]BBN99577.1 acyltransferase [Sporolactobacillus terrae]